VTRHGACRGRWIHGQPPRGKVTVSLAVVLTGILGAACATKAPPQGQSVDEPHPRVVPPVGSYGEFTAVAVSPDRSRLATADEYGWVSVWEESTLRPFVRFQTDFRGTPIRLQFSGNGRLLLLSEYDDYASAGEARLWDLSAREEIGRFPFTSTTDGSGGVALSPDGRWIAATFGTDVVVTSAQQRSAGLLTASSVVSGVRAPAFEHHPEAAGPVTELESIFSGRPGELLVVSRQTDSAAIIGLDGAAPTALPTDGVATARTTPDGEHVVTVGEDGTVRFWAREPLRQIWRRDLGSGPDYSRSTIRFNETHDRLMLASGLDEDSAQIALLRSQDGEVLASTRTRAGSVDMDPSGEFVAFRAGMYDFEQPRSGTWLLEARTGLKTETTPFAFEGDPRYRQVRFLTGGRLFVNEDGFEGDGRMIWDFRVGERLDAMFGRQLALWPSPDFLPDGRGVRGGCYGPWTLASGAPYLSLNDADPDRCDVQALSPDGSLAVVDSLWRWSDVSVVDVTTGRTEFGWAGKIGAVLREDSSVAFLGRRHDADEAWVYRHSMASNQPVDSVQVGEGLDRRFRSLGDSLLLLADEDSTTVLSARPLGILKRWGCEGGRSLRPADPFSACVGEDSLIVRHTLTGVRTIGLTGGLEIRWSRDGLRFAIWDGTTAQVREPLGGRLLPLPDLGDVRPQLMEFDWSGDRLFVAGLRAGEVENLVVDLRRASVRPLRGMTTLPRMAAFHPDRPLLATAEAPHETVIRSLDSGDRIISRWGGGSSWLVSDSDGRLDGPLDVVMAAGHWNGAHPNTRTDVFARWWRPGLATAALGGSDGVAPKSEALSDSSDIASVLVLARFGEGASALARAREVERGLLRAASVRSMWLGLAEVFAGSERWAEAAGAVREFRRSVGVDDVAEPPQLVAADVIQVRAALASGAGRPAADAAAGLLLSVADPYLRGTLERSLATHYSELPDHPEQTVQYFSRAIRSFSAAGRFEEIGPTLSDVGSGRPQVSFGYRWGGSLGPSPDTILLRGDTLLYVRGSVEHDFFERPEAWSTQSGDRLQVDADSITASVTLLPPTATGRWLTTLLKDSSAAVPTFGRTHLRVWPSGEILAQVGPSGLELQSVATDSTGTRLFDRVDGAIREWDANTGQELRRIPVSTSSYAWEGLTVSPDGRWAALHGGSGADTLEIVDTLGGETLLVVEGSRAEFVSGLVVAGSEGFSGDSLHHVAAWDLDTGEQVWRFDAEGYPRSKRFDWSRLPDGHSLIVSFASPDSARDEFVLIDSRDGSSSSFYFSPADPVTTIAATDGLLAVGRPDGIWLIESGSQRITGRAPGIFGETRAMNPSALIVRNGLSIQVHDPTTGILRHTIPSLDDHSRYEYMVSSDARHLLQLGWPSHELAGVLDGETLEPRPEPLSIRFADQDPTRSRLLVTRDSIEGSGDRTVLGFYDPATSTVEEYLRLKEYVWDAALIAGRVASVTWNRSGRRVRVLHDTSEIVGLDAASSPTIRRWGKRGWIALQDDSTLIAVDVPDASQRLIRWSAGRGWTVLPADSTATALEGREGGLLSDVLSSSSGRFLWIEGPGRSALFDTDSGTEVASWGASFDAAFLPDDRGVVLVSGDEISLLRLDVGAEWTAPGWSAQLQRPYFSWEGPVVAPSGALVAVGPEVFSTASGELVAHLDGRTEGRPTFLPGHNIVTLSVGHETVFFDMDTWSQVLTRTTLPSGDWVDMAPDGRVDGTDAGLSKVHLPFRGQRISVGAVGAGLYSPALAMAELGRRTGTGAVTDPEVTVRDRFQLELELAGMSRAAREALAREFYLGARASSAPADSEVRLNMMIASGLSFLASGRPEAARAVLEEAEYSAQTIDGNDPMLLHALLGRVYLELGIPQLAIERLLRFDAPESTVGVDPRDHARALTDLSRAYTSQGEVARAHDVAEDAAASARAIGQPELIALTLRQYSRTLADVGRPDSAVVALRIAVSAVRDVAHAADEYAESLLSLADADTAAREELSGAMSQLRGTVSPRAGVALLLFALGDTAQPSIPDAPRALDVSRSPSATIADSLDATLASLQTRPEDVDQLVAALLARARLSRRTPALADSASNWRADAYSAASHAAQTNQPWLNFRTLVELADFLLEDDEFYEASHLLEQASAVSQLLRDGAGSLDETRVGVADRVAAMYAAWVRSWILQAPELGSREAAYAALAVAERGRAQALVESLRATNEPAADSCVEEAGSLTYRLVSEGRCVAEAATRAGSAVLSYMQVGDSLVVWRIDPGGDIRATTRPVTSDRLSGDLVQLRRALGLGSEGPELRGSDQLEPGPRVGPRASGSSSQVTLVGIVDRLSSTLVGDGILEGLPEGRALVVVPQGALALVPFELMKTEDGAYLGDRNPLRYSPSVTALQSLQEAARPLDRGQITGLVVGDPQTPPVSLAGTTPVSLAPLDGAREEAAHIARGLGVDPILGALATEAEVRTRLRGADLVHLATHGYAFSSRARARESFVALAKDAEGLHDGILTVREIFEEVDLAAELVVLSACQTGLGALSESEGTIGLQRALLAKGARSVIVSLWDVDDTATSMLMQSFYDYWQLGHGLSKSEALAQAKLDLRKSGPEFDHPRYWAAFQLVGAN